jgi:hypothetical protein
LGSRGCLAAVSRRRCAYFEGDDGGQTPSWTGPGDVDPGIDRRCPRASDVDQGIHLGHLVTAPSHRSCDLLLKATRGVTIAIVSSLERKRRQPGLATDDPAFVGWHQLVSGIQGSYVHFDFVCAASENGRAAAGAEKWITSRLAMSVSRGLLPARMGYFRSVSGPNELPTDLDGGNSDENDEQSG